MQGLTDSLILTCTTLYSLYAFTDILLAYVHAQYIVPIRAT